MTENTITMNTINTCSTWTVRDDSPRGVKTVSAAEIKPGDEVVYNNDLAVVIDEPETSEAEQKLAALKSYLIDEGEATADEIEGATVANTNNDGGDTFEIIGNEYRVLTDEEADEAAREAIINDLWAFNADFIITHTEFWNTCTQREADEAAAALREMQSRLCESANAIVKALIADLDEFVEDAIDADGRGHFLSWYDGEEYESGKYYIYRTN